MKPILIPIDTYDPTRHILPTAYEPVKAGHIVELCVGMETFTVALADSRKGVFDGVVLRDANVSEPVWVLGVHKPRGDGTMITMMYVLDEGL